MAKGDEKDLAKVAILANGTELWRFRDTHKKLHYRVRVPKTDDEFNEIDMTAREWELLGKLVESDASAELDEEDQDKF